MNVTDNLKLLRNYADSGDETAFRELVKRYVDLVYSAAFRRVGGDAGLAQDVTQTVFTDLARKAKSLRNVELLGGWLHRHTGFVASNMVRSEQRRQIREQEAAQMNATHDPPDSIWQQLAPVLDDTIESLEPEERQAVLLRFFERHDFRHIGNALGISDNAAQKRVSRALEKLRGLLTARGVTLSVVLLSTLLAGRVIGAAPVGLAGSVAGVALSGAAGGGLGLMLFNLTKSLSFKIALGGTVGAAALWLFWEQHSISTTGAGGQSNSITTLAGTTNVPLANNNNQPPATALTSQANSTNATGKVLVITVVAADSGQPVPNVKLVKQKTTFEADRFGVCSVPIPDSAFGLSLVSERDGFADTKLEWRPDRGEQIPAQYTLRLARTVPISGKVVDPDGNPVAGAQVGFNNIRDGALETRPQSDNFEPFWITATTDAQGRWQIDRIGKEALKTIYGSASHPEFVQSRLSEVVHDPQMETQLLDGSFVFKLGHAVTVQGIVKDPDGQPVPNANVLVGQAFMSDSRRGKSGTDGTFTIVGCKPGSNIITAQIKGYAPASVNAKLTDSSGPFELVLRPGKVVKLRVTDEDGNPVSGAVVMLDSIQHRQTDPHDKEPTPPQVSFNERTDTNGLLEWDDAPDQKLTFDVFATGYMTTRGVKLYPDGTEHVVTIQPALTISGTVSDATTGQPIPRFRIVAGWPRLGYGKVAGRPQWGGTTNVTWMTLDRFWLSFDGGKFQYTYEEPLENGVRDPKFMFKFVANGYAPFVTSVVQASERSVRFDVALTPAPTMEVTVLSPSGTPEVNADIGFVSPGAGLILVPGGFSRESIHSGGSLLQTDNQGQFALAPDPSIIKIVAASPEGYAETTPSNLATNPVLQMLPWGRIEGVCETNGQPCARCTLTIQYGQDSFDAINCSFSSFRTKTDSNGHFTFAQVPSGKREVAMGVAQNIGMENEVWTQKPVQSVDVQAGETTTITIGDSNQTNQASSNSAN